MKREFVMLLVPLSNTYSEIFRTSKKQIEQMKHNITIHCPSLLVEGKELLFIPISKQKFNQTYYNLYNKPQIITKIHKYIVNNR